jgi:hypothetical protein
MKRLLALAGACAALLVVGFGNAAGASGTVVCSGSFSGTASNVIVPAGNECDLTGAQVDENVVVGRDGFVFASALSVGNDLVLRLGAGVFFPGETNGAISIANDAVLAGANDFEVGGTTIGHDLTSGTNSGFHLERTTIGHDFRVFQPHTVQTGQNAPDSPGGPVHVGHDFQVVGSPPGEEFVFDGICLLTVDHDLRVLGRTVDLGIGLGDERCAAASANTIGHDLVFAGNSAVNGFFGASSLEIGNNSIGHNLIVTGNTAAAILEVSDNSVGNNALCAGNNPPPTTDGPDDGPNIVGGINTCG